MSRTITITKTGDTTVVKVVDNGKTTITNLNNSRTLQLTSTGVKIVPSNNETKLNNFEIKLAELTNDGIDFSAVTTPEELLNKLALEKCFKQGGGLGSDEIQTLINNTPYTNLPDTPTTRIGQGYKPLVSSVTEDEDVYSDTVKIKRTYEDYVVGDVSGTSYVVRYLGADGKYYQTNANDSAKSTSELLFCLDILLPADSSSIGTKKGIITGLTGLRAGYKYYLSEGPGGITEDTSSFASTSIIRYVGTAIGTTSLYFNPSEPILSGELRLQAYPNTRNDGQLPTNKVLSTDANGNLKLYTIATAPAPYLEDLIPDSNLPSTTGNFTLRGSFFTPDMTIVVEGQTLNYWTFVSDNEVIINLTTGATEGTFDITLNNGLEAIFADVLLIVLGTVFTPVDANWINKITVDTTESGAVKLLNKDVIGTASLDTTFWTFTPNVGKRFTWKWNESPLENSPYLGGATDYGISFYRLDGTLIYRIGTYAIQKVGNLFRLEIKDFITPTTNNNFEATSYATGMARTYTLERLANGIITLKRDGAVVWTPTFQETLELKVLVKVAEVDVINIKSIDLN